MPNVAVLVSDVQPSNSGVISRFVARTDTDVQVIGEVEVDFGLGAAITNQNIEAAAKAAMAAVGVTIGPLDKVILFGGRVS